MKIENTPENKAKFFAIYYDQVTVLDEHWSVNPQFMSANHIRQTMRSEIDATLLLIPLSQIIDKDAIDVFDLLFSHSETHRNKPDDFKVSFGEDWANSIFFDSYGQYYPKDYIQMIDFLRSKGYALPFMGISVETLIEWGWIKLKEPK